MDDPVRPLVLIAGGQALAALAMTLIVAVAAPGSDLLDGVPVATVAVWLLLSAALALVWWGLFRRRRAAHAPFLLAQAMALVVAWPLVSSDVAVDQVAGGALGVAAVMGLVLGLRPAVHDSLAAGRVGADIPTEADPQTDTGPLPGRQP